MYSIRSLALFCILKNFLIVNQTSAWFVFKGLCGYIFVQAKAAIQGGLKKGNARERSALAKVNKDGQENRKTDQSTNSSDSLRYTL